MSFTRLAWLFSGASVAVLASAASVAACSSSSTSAAPADAGSAAPVDAGAMIDTGTGEGAAPATDSGTCEKPPKTFPETKPGVYCPFSAADGGPTQTCQPGQHCCETPSGGPASTCEAMGTACPVPNSVDWQCEEAIDCLALDAGTPVCCGAGTATTATHCGITWPEWTAFTGTTCASSCPAPGITVCEQSSDCTGDAGTTCTPSKASGNNFGFCN